VKIPINQRTTMRFCMLNAKFKGRREKKRGKKALSMTNRVVLKERGHYNASNDMV